MRSPEFYQRLLDEVSRSFALCIPRLEPPFRDQVALAYLLMRVLDTVEDAPFADASHQQRQFERLRRFLRRMPALIEVDAFIAEFPDGIAERERNLLGYTLALLEDAHAVALPARIAIFRAVDRMAKGMAAYTRRPSGLYLVDVEDVARYCCFVAGLVGEMLTELWALGSSAPPPGVALAYHFGLFLQKVNILKDQKEDEAASRFLVPDRAELLASLHRDADGALEYLLALPPSDRAYRTFCAWCLMMGAATVAQLDQPRQSRRAETAELLARTAAIAHDNATLGRQFAELMPPLPVLAMRAPRPKPESIEWFRDTLAAPISDAEFGKLGRGAVISRIFARLARLRWVVIAIYAVLVPIAAYVANHIPHEGAIDRLIVPSDPDYIATREFQQIFPEPQLVLLVFESPDPWSPPAIARVDRAARVLAAVPHVQAFSPIDAIRKSHPNAPPETLRALATGTDFFRRQGLVGPDFVTIIANLEVGGPEERDAALAGIDFALAGEHVHKVGGPYVSSWLERETASATAKSFAVFGALVVVVTLFLYRSPRALLAIVLSLGASVALAVAAGALLGFSFTIVSVLVPLAVMVTTLATLTYLHLRFIDQPAGVPLAAHQVVALRNKFLPVTASTLAAAMGFAALAVSSIRPIREMGLWTAVGMLVAWVVAFTLFPALQLVLRTPTARKVPVRTAVYDRMSRAIPRFTYRYRRWLVGGALAACTAGAFAVAGMSVEVDVLASIDPGSPISRDLRWFRDHVMSLDMVRVWIHMPRPTATDPEVLRAVDWLNTALDTAPRVTGVAGPTTLLRMRSYFAGHGDVMPTDPAAFARATADVEELLLTQPDLRTFIDPNGLADMQLTVLFHDGNAAAYAAMVRTIDIVWSITYARSPALAGARMEVVGESLLRVKVGASLVPTLAASLLITVGFILIVFLVVSRSPIERLLAMIPSAFALLVTFLGLRVFGGALNIATIIIATTVLGTTENDQLHLFHHMHERPRDSLEHRLAHTLRVSGRAIVFATIIYASGFLALATSNFPPLRQFGIMTAAAFVLAMIADFTLLPAALWLASRERPDARSGVDRMNTDNA